MNLGFESGNGNPDDNWKEHGDSDYNDYMMMMMMCMIMMITMMMVMMSKGSWGVDSQ